MMPETIPEMWLDKKGIARHFACSVRSIEFAVADGLPHATIFGRAKFRVSECEAWLEDSGRLERHGRIDGDIKRPGDAANVTEPNTEGAIFDAQKA
jgi:hypothetical protein